MEGTVRPDVNILKKTQKEFKGSFLLQHNTHTLLTLLQLQLNPMEQDWKDAIRTRAHTVSTSVLCTLAF
jgi:hypothetical protein